MNISSATIEEVRPHVSEAISLFNKFNIAETNWLSECALKGVEVGAWELNRIILEEGDPVGAEEKGAWGVQPWLKIGRRGWEALTDIGRHNPRDAVKELHDHIFWRHSMLHRRWQLADVIKSTTRNAQPFYAAMSIDADELCCQASRAMSGKCFAVSDFPDLPLADCDQVWCKCRFEPLCKRELDARPLQTNLYSRFTLADAEPAKLGFFSRLFSKK